MIIYSFAILLYGIADDIGVRIPDMLTNLKSLPIVTFDDEGTEAEANIRYSTNHVI